MEADLRAGFCHIERSVLRAVQIAGSADAEISREQAKTGVTGRCEAPNSGLSNYTYRIPRDWRPGGGAGSNIFYALAGQTVVGIRRRRCPHDSVRGRCRQPSRWSRRGLLRRRSMRIPCGTEYARARSGRKRNTGVLVNWCSC